MKWNSSRNEENNKSKKHEIWAADLNYFVAGAVKLLESGGEMFTVVLFEFPKCIQETVFSADSAAFAEHMEPVSC